MVYIDDELKDDLSFEEILQVIEQELDIDRVSIEEEDYRELDFND